VTGTRLRLREVREADGTVTRKLGHKVRLSEGPAEVACTNLYLDDEEWTVLVALPARLLRKKRHLVQRDGLTVAIDEHEDGFELVVGPLVAGGGQALVADTALPGLGCLLERLTDTLSIEPIGDAEGERLRAKLVPRG
jgi:hypothetical protein